MVYIFNLDKFKNQIKTIVTEKVKSSVGNAPQKHGFTVLEIERKISLVSDMLEEELKPELDKKYGIEVTSIEISDIEIDKNSDAYKKYMKATNNVATGIVQGGSKFL